jgi:hypothetical protein
MFKIETKLFLLLFWCFSFAKGNNDFVCSKSTARLRQQDLEFVSNKNGHIFYVTSYLAQLQVHGYEFGGNKVVNTRFLHIASEKFSEKLELLNKTFVEEHQKCVKRNQPLKVYVAREMRNLKELGAYTRRLMHGCKLEVYSNNSLKAEKAVLITIEVWKYSNLTEDQTTEILSHKHGMTELNYEFFRKKGFCICDEIINYLECDDDKPGKSENEYFMLVIGIFAVCFVAVLVSYSYATKVCREVFKSNRNQTAVIPLAIPQPQIEPVFVLTSAAKEENVQKELTVENAQEELTV